jgi:hypothetical protein
MQKITTTGNATIIAYDNGSILTSDPWIGDEDPAYFGSWALSHEIPSELKNDIAKSKYIWFSHGHPDHLNPISILRYKANQILLPDHVGSRIFKDLSELGLSNVTILPDRLWVQLSEKIKVQSITTKIQDSVLLIDVCGKLFINLNDAGVRDCAGYLRSIVAQYQHSYLLSLTGYGDADMINFFDEAGNRIAPHAAQRDLVGKQFSNLAKITGAKSVIPSSSFHQYQRADSIWAQEFTTPIEAYTEGLSEQIEYIKPFCTIDCNTLEVENYLAKEHKAVIKNPEEFGDNWSDELSFEDKRQIEQYFSRKDRVQNYFGFINFRVGGKDFVLRMKGKPERGITFSVPRGSLMTSIEYRIFDDLLIGNYMKTTLHNCESLYQGVGNFNFNVAKYGDNGLAETEQEVQLYLAEYRRRAGFEFILGSLEDKSKDFLVRFIGRNSKLTKAIQSLYFKVR